MWGAGGLGWPRLASAPNDPAPTPLHSPYFSSISEALSLVEAAAPAQMGTGDPVFVLLLVSTDLFLS